jgi:hypothetical protein
MDTRILEGTKAGWTNIGARCPSTEVQAHIDSKSLFGRSLSYKLTTHWTKCYISEIKRTNYSITFRSIICCYYFSL